MIVELEITGYDAAKQFLTIDRFNNLIASVEINAIVTMLLMLSGGDITNKCFLSLFLTSLF